MDVSIGECWEGFVQNVVKDGRFGSVSDVVDEALRLLQEREVEQQVLRETLEASIARGGSYTDEEVRIYIASRLNAKRLAKENNRQADAGSV